MNMMNPMVKHTYEIILCVDVFNQRSSICRFCGHRRCLSTFVRIDLNFTEDSSNYIKIRPKFGDHLYG